MSLNTELALEVKNLKKTYALGHEALKGISLSVKKGEIFGLLGPNGAGKTSTINIMGGVVSKTSGDVNVFGTSIDEDHVQVKKMIGVVPQELVYDRFFTVEQSLQFQAGYYGVKNPQQIINELLKALSLEDKRNVSAGALSGGMKRRLMVAKALVHDPDLIVLDEPTAGVDIELRWGLWEYVKTLHSRGKTIILTTHYLEEAESMCDRIAIMEKGTVLALDTLKNLKSQFGDTQKEIHFFLEKSSLPKENPFGIKKKEDRFFVSLPETKMGKFFSWTESHNLNLQDVSIQEKNLEDVFLNLIQHG